MSEENAQVISVGEAAYLNHLKESLTEMRLQTHSMAMIADILGDMLKLVRSEIAEAKATD